MRRSTLLYFVLLAVTVAGYAWIRGIGEGLPPGQAAREGAATGGLDENAAFGHVLLALAVITFAARLVGGAFRRFLNQPPVIGEIVAGLVLGPSLLGALAPGAYAYLLPAQVAPLLGVLAQIGVVLFLFLIGLELDLKAVRRSSHTTLAISHASIVAPFLLGAAFALYLYPRYATADVGFTAFSLFLGIALSITAFPVLARILTDRGLQSTPLGVRALACAAVDDVTAWTALAFVVGIVGSNLDGALATLLRVIAYLALMFLVVRPILLALVARAERGDEPLTRTATSLVFVGLLLSAFATEAIGIHALFGAFLFGALVPHDGKLAEAVRRGTADLVVVVFLPAFFAFTGMRTEIGLLDTPAEWTTCAVLILVATLGKFGGGALAGRLVGLRWAEASAIGILMNARGLMELIVLNLGLDLGVISPTLFAMMVLMALATTFVTAPLLQVVLRRHPSLAVAPSAAA